jgi:hypothetical protein
MNSSFRAKASAIALLALTGLALPAPQAHAQELPIDLDLCGLLSLCDQAPIDDVPLPVDVDTSDGQADVNVDLDDDADVNNDTDVDGDAVVDLDPDNGHAADIDVNLLGNAVGNAAPVAATGNDASSDLHVDIVTDDGIVVTARGTADTIDRLLTPVGLANADGSAEICGVQVVVGGNATSRCESSGPTGSGAVDGALADVDGDVAVCGVQVVVAGSSSSNCDPTGGSVGTTGGSGGDGDGVDVLGNVGVCGVQFAVAGSASTDCAQPSPTNVNLDAVDELDPLDGIDLGDIDGLDLSDLTSGELLQSFSPGGNVDGLVGVCGISGSIAGSATTDCADNQVDTGLGTPDPSGGPGGTGDPGTPTHPGASGSGAGVPGVAIPGVGSGSGGSLPLTGGSLALVSIAGALVIAGASSLCICRPRRRASTTS